MRKQSRKKFALMLAVLLALQSTACGENPEPSVDTPIEETELSSNMSSTEPAEQRLWKKHLPRKIPMR